MKIRFIINYHTRWGETLHISGTIAELGGGNADYSVQMECVGDGLWQKDIDVAKIPESFEYSFLLKSGNETVRREWGAPHIFVSGEYISRYIIYAAWQDIPSDKPFYSSAFTDGILRRAYRDQPLVPAPNMVCLRVEAPVVSPDEYVAISGNIDFLGNWNPARAIRMNDARFPAWEINLPLDELSDRFEYKFIIIRESDGTVSQWEERDNRTYSIPRGISGEYVEIEGMRFAESSCDWKGAGTAIPVFSIRTESDFGTGDFSSLKPMIDWCVKTGQKVLQVLPVNDTTQSGTWRDSYPYSAITSFALHPLYIRLEEVGRLSDPARRDYYEKLRRELNALPTLDYELVMNGKMSYLREIFAEQGANTLESREFAKFFEHNESWLKPYAAWRVLLDIYGTSDNGQWSDMSVYDKDRVEVFLEKHKDEANFYYYVQYHLDKQLRAARRYAHSKNMVLKGDIPIGIGRYSVDAWTSPSLLNINTQAGAPPDDFCDLGQNWGFPTYNWDEMDKDGYLWWKNRFRKMSEFFDAYRIDHILGFFRIWEIPNESRHGLLGYFNPALPYSADELANEYDFRIDVPRHTRPLITDEMLQELAGDLTSEITGYYLRSDDDTWELRPEVATQQQICDLLNNNTGRHNAGRIRDILMLLCDDVLFVEDPYKPGHYHPRISGYKTWQYRMLTEEDRQKFDRLYHDFYYERHNEFWKENAMRKLPPLIDATSMLTCAEDLGMIPACVPQVMDNLKILALEVERMPKAPWQEFGIPSTYPYYTVCTTSTHDMGGIRAWWESDAAMAGRFFANVLGESGEAPKKAEPGICERIVEMMAQSPSMLCILPLQDWLSTDGALRRDNPADEQINEPANPRHYWRYRMHLTVEQLLSSPDFNHRISRLISASDR